LFEGIAGFYENVWFSEISVRRSRLNCCLDATESIVSKQEIPMRGRKTSIAISAAIGLGIVGAAFAAQAGDQTDERGGYVVPGSVVGVNPVYHPRWFANVRGADAAGLAYGYAPEPIHKRRPVHERAQDR
jgi:hypothetical protein